MLGPELVPRPARHVGKLKVLRRDSQALPGSWSLEIISREKQREARAHGPEGELWEYLQSTAVQFPVAGCSIAYCCPTVTPSSLSGFPLLVSK